MRTSVFSLSATLSGAALTSAMAPGYIPALMRRALSAKVTIGSTPVPFSFEDGQQILGDGLSKLCSDFGCDQGTSYTTDPINTLFSDFGDTVTCQWVVDATGNYDSTDERDYMISLLKQSLTTASVSTEITFSEIGEGCATQGAPGCTNEMKPVTNSPNFLQLELDSDDGGNNAQMTARISLECNDGNGFNCDSPTVTAVKGALGEVPGVGGVIATIFDVICAASG